MPPRLILPTSLDPVHADLLREHHFEAAGALRDAIRTDAFDGVRALYAITNPEQTAIVYIGDTEEGRDVRGRFKSHLNDRSKLGQVEKDSLAYVHVMVTEYLVLDRFEQETGKLPLLNRRKVAKHMTRNWTRNGAEEAQEYREMMERRKAEEATPAKAPRVELLSPGGASDAPKSRAKKKAAAPVKAPAKRPR